MENGVCREPAGFYLMGVALRSFFLVLATHLLAGEVDTTLAGLPLLRRLSWWCRYYNPLNLSWRYYSMLAYRFTAHAWGTAQLALVNHEAHPLLPPLPYIIGETVSSLRVRRLEMAGLLSSQGILTFSAAYQGALAIQYAISTEGIPYLPNTTVPLAMVGLFRVMACKWVASKIQVDAYPYPCIPPSSTPHACNNAGAFSRFLQMCTSSLGALCASSPTMTENNASSSAALRKEIPLSSSAPDSTLRIDNNHPPPSASVPPTQLRFDTSSSPSAPALNMPSSTISAQTHFSVPSSGLANATCSLPMIHLPYRQLPSLFLHVSTTHPPPSPPPHSPSPRSPLLSRISHACKLPPSSVQAPNFSPSFSKEASEDCQSHAHPSSLSIEQPPVYKSNKIVVVLWIGVLVGLVTMSFLPYKVANAYQLPSKLLEFSMQIFYQYIAVSEFFFHGYLLYQGPRALANRVLFFDHLAFKAQTVGFFMLLVIMLVVAVLDFVKHDFYRTCV